MMSPIRSRLRLSSRSTCLTTSSSVDPHPRSDWRSRLTVVSWVRTPAWKSDRNSAYPGYPIERAKRITVASLAPTLRASSAAVLNASSSGWLSAKSASAR